MNTLDLNQLISPCQRRTAPAAPEHPTPHPAQWNVRPRGAAAKILATPADPQLRRWRRHTPSLLKKSSPIKICTCALGSNSSASTSSSPLRNCNIIRSSGWCGSHNASPTGNKTSRKFVKHDWETKNYCGTNLKQKENGHKFLLGHQKNNCVGRRSEFKLQIEFQIKQNVGNK